MTNLEKDIYQRFLEVAFLIHNYRIGDKEYFYSLFPKVSKDVLDKVWLVETTKLPIVSFYENLSNEEDLGVKEKLRKLRLNYTQLFDYLTKPINKNSDVKMECALRKLMALRYIEYSKYTINDFWGIPDIYLSLELKEKRTKNDRKILFGIMVVILITISLPRIIEGFTPVETLARKYYEESRYTYSGSICRDGWKSHSRGRGTCSHHGGVKSYFQKGDYSLTFQQCIEIAKERSWRE